MKKTLLLAAILVVMPLFAPAITLEECLERAEANYPLIKQRALVEQTADLQLSDINKAWLPRIGVYGQATAQNVVPEFPQTLTDILAQLGQESRGLGHLQYKVGVDLTQTIWDGGASRSQRQIERASEQERQASLSTQLYAVRQKVMDLYFGILLIDEQIAQSESTLRLLEANLALMRSMQKEGVATQADADMVEAQTLAMTQQLMGARSASAAYRSALSVYVGEDLQGATLERPQASMPADMASARPELTLYDARQRLNTARLGATQSIIMPRIGLFAQAYYGYPGINYFESMTSRKLSFNVVGGVKLSWSIDALYTHRSAQRRLSLTADMVDSDRETFLFNSRLLTTSQSREIEGMKAVIADDARIVELRRNVRLAAESQLKNGVIDATALLSKITDENQARLAATYHEIELIQKIYKLKYTINR